jgi:mannose-6-phosphate isomerase-like protein (cupin superfamily)
MKKEERPWGDYEILHESENYKIKLIRIYPNEEISLQTHEHRDEHWIVVRGTAIARIGSEEHILQKGSKITIRAKEKHRLSNKTNTELLLVEVQIGCYLGEDDIIRYEDKYGRAE